MKNYCIITMFCVSQILHANQDDITLSLDSNTDEVKSYIIDNVIATGSPIASDISKIPGNVSIINKQNITQMPNMKPADIVKRLAGVYVQRDTGFNPRPSIRIRGINYGTLIMLDGVILSDLEGETRILNQISLYDVERVEVARGAFSSLYGTNAIGGVINFITSMPNKLQLEAIAGYGSEFQKNTANRNVLRFYGSVGNAFLDKKLRTKISVGINSDGGYPNFPAVYGGNNGSNLMGSFVDKVGRRIIGDGGRRDTIIWDTRAKIEYDIGDTSMLSSMFSISNHSYDYKDFTSYLKDGHNIINTDKDYFVGSGFGGYGSYTHIIGNVSYSSEFDEAFFKVSLSSVNLLSFWQDADLTKGGNRFGGPGTTQDINTSSNYLDFLYNFSINNIHSISTALQFRYYYLIQENYSLTDWRKDTNLIGIPILPKREGESFRAYGSQAIVASGYVNLDSNWMDNLSTSFGLRYDYWQNFESFSKGTSSSASSQNQKPLQTQQFSPKASINYNITSYWLMKASVGSGFRMPTLREIFPLNAGEFRSNTDLKPEVGLSFEFGTELQSKYANLSLYYFQTELFDMIYRSGSGITVNDPGIFKNAGYGRINGVEVSAIIPIYDFGTWGSLSLEGNYTLTNSKIIKNSADPSSIGKYLPDIPIHMGNVALHLSSAKTLDYIGKTNNDTNYIGGVYASLWAHFASEFFNDSRNSPVLSNTFGYYEAQFSLNAKLGYIFDRGFDISMQFLNITNNRYYDFYIVQGASFYAQLRYKWNVK
ncbi:TonB-dependent receptor [Helicobacter muridarum]|nr:TonB-dependent receptor [Helicobacter muridarum]STQ85887.1 TonB-dependent receptor protein [Helicobacter muridarum]